jgi:hypothetical protein
MKKPDDGRFGVHEAKERFETALGDARVAGHKPMESLTWKGATTQSKSGKKAKKKSARTGIRAD